MTHPIPWKQIAELAETVVNGDDPSIHARFEARAKLGNALDPATVLQMVAEHAAVREALERARGCIKDLLGLHDAVFDEGVFGFDEGCGEELCGASLCEECGCVADKVDAARAALTGVEHERLAND